MRSLMRSMFWISFSFGMLSFALPIYARELGASAWDVGVMFAVFSLVPVFIRPVLGQALDRWGRRPFLLLGFASYAAAMVVFALGGNVGLLTVGRFIQGLGQAFLWLAALTVVSDLAAATGRGQDFGLVDESVNRGALVGTTLGFFAYFYLANARSWTWSQTWPWLFGAYALLALWASWGVWRGVPETRQQATEDQSATDDQPATDDRPFSRQLLALMGIVFVTGASSSMAWPMLTIFLQDSIGADASSLAWAYLPAALLNTFLPSRLGRYADRFGRKPPMIAGLLVGALASAAIPVLGSLIMLAVLWAIESVGYSASVPAERAFVADIAGKDMRGSSYGWYTFAFFLGGVFGPLLGGWLYDHWTPAAPFYLNAVVLVAGAVLVGLALREPRRSEQAPV